MRDKNENEIGKATGAADDPRVTAYVFGQLEGSELFAFEQLVAGDADYRAVVEQTRELTGLLECDGMFEADGAQVLSTSRMEALEAAMDPNSARRYEIARRFETAVAGRAGARWVPLLAVLSAAATLAGVLLWSGDSMPEQTSNILAINDQQKEMIDSLALEEIEVPENEAILSAGIERDLRQQQIAEQTGAAGKVDGSGEVTAAMPADAKEVAKRSDGAVPDSPSDSLAGSLAEYGPGHPITQSPSPFEFPANSEASAGGNRVAGDASAGGQARFRNALGSSAGGYPGGGPSQATSDGGVGEATGYPVAGSGSGMGGGSGGYGMGMGDYEEGAGMGAGMGAGAMSGGRAVGRELGRFGPPTDSYRRETLSERRFDDYYRASSGTGYRYSPISDNPFESVVESPLSTFSIDVDTAAYSQLRMMLQQYNRLPNPDAVRIEEMLNYFYYDYRGPGSDEVPFAANMELAMCPWNEQHKLARIAIKGREIGNSERPVSNLVFLLDVSGSMNEANKLPLVRRGMEMLVSQLGENDRVAITVYAGAAGLVLDSTTADKKDVIFSAIDRLQAGGSTNGGQGIQLAYQTAREHFIKGGTNRVILCTDGDFNVGTTGTDQLVKLVEQEAKGGIFLSVLGFGAGNLNDAMLEAISGRGDGNYAFVDTSTEAHKILVEQLAGTLVTIAKDVKIQIEFNPALVQSYRLIGYENRMLAVEDFADDTKDAGEIGAGHTVTALYEIVPVVAEKPDLGGLKYQRQASKLTVDAGVAVKVEAGEFDDELLTLKLRYKEPVGGGSKLLEFPIKNVDVSVNQASDDLRFASAVAAFGMLLRNSPHRGDASFEGVRRLARDSLGEDKMGLRAEFLGLIDLAARLK